MHLIPERCFSFQMPKGERLIVIHAGGEDGFVENALLMWKASSSSGDYRCQVNFENYEKCVRKKLIPNLPTNSVVVLINSNSQASC